MIFSPRIYEAINLASLLHRDQVRNDASKTPYISHLMGVAFLLSSVTSDEDTIIAGMLHDSLEDVKGYTYEKLVEDCGERVARIVAHVTEPLDANKSVFDQLPWLTRKEMYLKRLEEGPIESILVSCADKIHNTESFLDSFKKEGEAFAQSFGSSMRNRIWLNEQVLTISEQRLGKDHVLVERLRVCTEEFKKFDTAS